MTARQRLALIQRRNAILLATIARRGGGGGGDTLVFRCSDGGFRLRDGGRLLVQKEPRNGNN